MRIRVEDVEQQVAAQDGKSLEEVLGVFEVFASGTLADEVYVLDDVSGKRLKRIKTLFLLFNIFEYSKNCVMPALLSSQWAFITLSMAEKAADAERHRQGRHFHRRDLVLAQGTPPRRRRTSGQAYPKAGHGNPL